MVPVVGVRTLAFVASDARASVLVAPRGLPAAGVPASTLPVGVVFPADGAVSGATVAGLAAAPRPVFAGVVFAAAFVVRRVAAAFVAAGAVVDFGAVDLAAVAVVAVDFAVACFVDAVLLAAVFWPAALAELALAGLALAGLALDELVLAGLALVAADLLWAGVAAALAAFPVGIVFPDAFAGALMAAGFGATDFAPALAGPVAFAVVDVFLPVRPDAAPADAVAVVARARPAGWVAATERLARAALGTVSVASVVPCAVRARASAVRATPALSAITFPPIYETTGAAWPRTAKAGKNTEPKAGRQTCHTI